MFTGSWSFTVRQGEEHQWSLDHSLEFSLEEKIFPVCIYGHTRLNLGFSAKLRIWQVPACKMEPRSGIISWKNHQPTHPHHMDFSCGIYSTLNSLSPPIMSVPTYYVRPNLSCLSPPIVSVPNYYVCSGCFFLCAPHLLRGVAPSKMCQIMEEVLNFLHPRTLLSNLNLETFEIWCTPWPKMGQIWKWKSLLTYIGGLFESYASHILTKFKNCLMNIERQSSNSL